MIGNANIFKRVKQSASPSDLYTIDLKPDGDLPGYYWGAVRFLLKAADDNTKPTATGGAATAVLNVEVAGASVFRHRHIQRSWFAPIQYYQFGTWNGTIWTNFVWRAITTAYNVAAATGTLIGNWAGGSTGAPLQSYMHAFFEPATTGPSAGTMAFTAGTTGNNPIDGMQANCEPVFFVCTVQPGQTIRLRCRLYREVPTSTQTPAVNDNAPASGSDAEPDEVLQTGQLYFEGWLVRVGRLAEEIQTIQSIGTVGGEE
jgi:hypothetical protein